MNIDIRPFSGNDHPALRAITWENRRGFLGDGTEQARFTDPRLFYELFVASHPRFEPQLAHLAVDRASTEVLGYVVATSDVAALDRWHITHHLPRLVGVAVGTVARGTANPSLRTVAQLLPMLRSATGVQRRLQHQLATHPASLHINLRASTKRTGVGSRLLATVEEQLRLLGVPGIQLGTSNTLPDAQPFYESRGYQAIDNSPAPHPYLSDYRVITMVKRLTG